ncbi:hypothetical protein BH11BAC1_BH11BAC1_14490 [soil metagenome]
MKRTYIIFILISLMLIGSVSQAQWKCADDILDSIAHVSIPRYDEIFQRENQKLNNYIKAHAPTGNTPGHIGNPHQQSTATYLIPVVFHVIYPAGQPYGTGTNISYAQILSQLNALNAAFAKDYPAYNGESHPAYAQNSDIQFCMARIAMPGNVNWYNGPGGTEFGVVRYANSTGEYDHTIGNAGAQDLLNITHPTPAYFPFTDYMNVWLVSTIDGGGGGTVMGYSPKPIMAAYPLEGLVMRADICGDNSTGNTFALGFGLTEGKVACHEIGHYLNLYHIFQGGCAGLNAAGSAVDACDLNGDFICDIEPCTTTNVPCGTVYNTCTANYATGTTTDDMTESYMSYSDDNCMNTFTMNQCERMWATLGTLRSNLWSTSNLIATGVQGNSGCVPSFLVSSIQIPTGTFCTGTTVTFNNPVNGNTAVSWNWQFPGGVPANATTASVNVIYASQGLHTAYLTVSDGATSITDSVDVAVLNCTVDSTLIGRSNWFWGTYASMDFSTGTAVANNAANANATVNGFESSVVQNDEHGNLLFYSDGVNLWDRNHVQMNAAPVFPWNNATVPGLIIVPYPKHPGKYYIVSSPPGYVAANGAQFVLVDIVANTISVAQRFNHPSIPTSVSECLTAVPHCNGIDYWVIIKGYPGDGRFYSILVTQDGMQAGAQPVISANFYSSYSAQIKGNHKGNKIGQAIFSSASYVFSEYDFNQATGVVSNEVLVAAQPGHQIGLGIVYSINDSVIYTIQVFGGNVNKLYKYDATNLAAPGIMMQSPVEGLYLEVGPDHNVYIAQTAWNTPYMDMVLNADSYVNSAFVLNAVDFTGIVPGPPYFVGTHVYCGVPNFMDALPPEELVPEFTFSNINCNTIQFDVDSCWQLYTATWDFGDGSALVTGLSVSHTYALDGNYSVTMTLAYGTFTLTPVIHVVNVFTPGANIILGPDTACTNTTYPYIYSVPFVNGATYSWTSARGSVVGLSNGNTFTITYTNFAIGYDTIHVVCTGSGCTFISTLIVYVSNPQDVALNLEPDQLCDDENILLELGSPPGGIFVINGIATDSAYGALLGVGQHVVTYYYTDAVGCYSQASDTLTVNFCLSTNELYSAAGILVYPNPVGDELIIGLNPAVKNSRIQEIELFNLLGEILFKETIPLKNNSKINTSQLLPGIYFLKLNMEAENVVVKVVKE